MRSASATVSRGSASRRHYAQAVRPNVCAHQRGIADLNVGASPCLSSPVEYSDSHLGDDGRRPQPGVQMLCVEVERFFAGARVIQIDIKTHVMFHSGVTER